jgi:hypothetical protein
MIMVVILGFFKLSQSQYSAVAHAYMTRAITVPAGNPIFDILQIRNG